MLLKSYHWAQQPNAAILQCMNTIDRIAGAGLASLLIACPAPSITEEVAMLVRRSEESNQALVRGDIDRYRELSPYTDDFTLMSPFGGEPSTDYDDARIERMRTFFKNGTLTQELVHAWASPEMIVLAVIERTNVEVGGLPAQDWALRVTLVYRRVGSQWQLAHRHADPLSHGITLPQAAALGRGEPMGG